MNLIIFVIVIAVLIFVHELGHFIAAKICKVYVEEFALGFGPKIFSFKRGETLYRLNLLPFGGYVKMLGEGDYADKSEVKNNPRSFESQSGLKKIFIIVAGVTMNFILAAIIYTILLVKLSFNQYIPDIVPNNFPFGNVVHRVGFQVDQSDKNSPIYKYNLKSVYVIDSFNGNKISEPEKLRNIIHENVGKKSNLNITDTQSGEIKSLELIPRENPPKGKGALGIVLSPINQIGFSSNIGEKFFSGVLYTIDMIQYNTYLIYYLVHVAIQSHNASVVTNNVTGPIGIYEYSGEVYNQFGILGLLNIVGLLSASLAFMNILPIPVLDGGYIFIILLELIIKREINPKIKIWITNIGVILLIGLMVAISINDINNFNIIERVKNIFIH